MDDENRKKAKQATDRLMLQTKAKEFQDKLKDLSRKEYRANSRESLSKGVVISP